MKRKVFKNLLNLPTGCAGKSKSKSHREKAAPLELSKSATSKKDEFFEGIYIQPVPKLSTSTEAPSDGRFAFPTLSSEPSPTQETFCRDTNVISCVLDHSHAKTLEDVSECNEGILLNVDETRLQVELTYRTGDEAKNENNLDIAGSRQSLSYKTRESIQKCGEQDSNGNVNVQENECKLTFVKREEILSNDDARCVDGQQRTLIKSNLGLEESLQLIVNPNIANNASSKNNGQRDKDDDLSVLSTSEKETKQSDKTTEPANRYSGAPNCAEIAGSDAVYSPKMFKYLSPKRVTSKKSTVKKIKRRKTLSTPPEVRELAGLEYYTRVSKVRHDAWSNNVTSRSEDTTNLLAQRYSFKPTNSTVAVSKGSKRYRRKHCFVVSPKRASIKYKKIKRTCLRSPYCCCCCEQCHCCYHQHCAKTFDHSTSEKAETGEEVDASFNSLDVQIDNLSIRTLSEGSDSERSWETVHSATSSNSRLDKESPVRLQYGRFEVKRTHSARVHNLNRNPKFSPKLKENSRVKGHKKQSNKDSKFKLNLCRKTSPLRKPVYYYGKEFSPNSSHQEAANHVMFTCLADQLELEHYNDDAYFQPFVQSEDELMEDAEKRSRMNNKRLMDLHKKSSNSIPDIGQLQLLINYQFGMLTVEVLEARNLQPQKTSLSNTYVKLSLVPDQEKRTYCTTDIMNGTNCPDFRELFSFELLADDSSKRLLISVWNKLFTSSEFLGCMSFGVKHLSANTRKGVCGWFYLLDEKLGRRKHLACTLPSKFATNRQQTIEYL